MQSSPDNTGLACTCDTCMMYIQLTDGDYEHDFTIAYIAESKQCVKQTPTDSNPETIGGSSAGLYARPPRGIMPFEIR
jgi:hypothetical protein